MGKFPVCSAYTLVTEVFTELLHQPRHWCRLFTHLHFLATECEPSTGSLSAAQADEMRRLAGQFVVRWCHHRIYHGPDFRWYSFLLAVCKRDSMMGHDWGPIHMFLPKSMAVSIGIENVPSLPDKIYTPPFTAYATDRHLHGCHSLTCEFVALPCFKINAKLVLRYQHTTPSSFFNSQR